MSREDIEMRHFLNLYSLKRKKGQRKRFQLCRWCGNLKATERTAVVSTILMATPLLPWTQTADEWQTDLKLDSSKTQIITQDLNQDREYLTSHTQRQPCRATCPCGERWQKKLLRTRTAWYRLVQEVYFDPMGISASSTLQSTTEKKILNDFLARPKHEMSRGKSLEARETVLLHTSVTVDNSALSFVSRPQGKTRPRQVALPRHGSRHKVTVVHPVAMTLFPSLLSRSQRPSFYKSIPFLLQVCNLPSKHRSKGVVLGQATTSAGYDIGNAVHKKIRSSCSAMGRWPDLSAVDGSWGWLPKTVETCPVP